MDGKEFNMAFTPKTARPVITETDKVDFIPKTARPVATQVETPDDKFSGPGGAVFKTAEAIKPGLLHNLIGAPIAGVLNLGTSKRASQTKRAFVGSQKLIEQARQTNDPVEKKKLLDRSRRIMEIGEMAAENLRENVDFAQRVTGFSDKELAQDQKLTFGKRIGSLLFEEKAGKVKLPTASNTVLNRIGGSALTGGVSSAMMGVSRALEDAETTEDFVETVSDFAKTGIIFGAVTQAGIEGFSGMNKGFSLVKNKVGEAIRKQARDNIVAEVNPNKTIRKEAIGRNIDMAESFVRKGYGDDMVANQKLAGRQATQATGILKKNVKNNERVIDAHKMLDDIADSHLTKVRTNTDKNAIIEWRDFQKQVAVDKYGSKMINSGAAIDEKVLAGQSGFKEKGLSVAESTVGKLDADYNRALRGEVIKVSGARKKQIENLFRMQEESLFWKTSFEEKILSQVPKSLAKKIGSLFFPTSLARETIGKGAQAIFDPLLKGTVSAQTPQLNIPTSGPADGTRRTLTGAAPAASNILDTLFKR